MALMVACAVEPLPVNQEEKTVPTTSEQNLINIPTQINASIKDEITKTAYDANGVFTWTSSDQVRLMVYRDNPGDNDTYKWHVLDYFMFGSPTLSSDNRIATFSSMIDLEQNGASSGGNTWVSTGYAVYPIDIAGKASYNETGCALVVLTDTPLGTLDQTPLIGKCENGAVEAGQDDFIFHTATGVMAIKLNNIPTTAHKLVIASLGSYNICGSFKLDDSDPIPQIKSEMNIHNKENKLFFDISSISGTHTFYIPMPVGEIPAQTLSVIEYETDALSGKDVVIMNKTIKPALSIVRNELLSIPALDASSQWTYLGEAWFMDSNLWQLNGLPAKYVDTSLYQNIADPNHYKAIYPYGNVTSQLGYSSTADWKTPADDELHFYKGMYANDGSVVLYDPHATGMHYVGMSSYKLDAHMFSGYQVCGYTGELAYSKVISSTSQGNPREIQLAPCYRDSYYYPWNGGYIFETGKDHEDGVVNIVFPGVYPEHFPSPVDMPRLPLTSDMITPSCSESTEGSINGLVDRIWNNGTGYSYYWHSPYNSPATDNTVYGIYLDIDLKGNSLQDFAVAFCLRNAYYNHPKHVQIYGSVDGTTWDLLQNVDDVMSGIGIGEWIYPIVCTGGTTAYKYIRISILSSSSSGTDNDLTVPGTYNCTHMAELELYGTYLP